MVMYDQQRLRLVGQHLLGPVDLMNGFSDTA